AQMAHPRGGEEQSRRYRDDRKGARPGRRIHVRRGAIPANREGVSTLLRSQKGPRPCPIRLVMDRAANIAPAASAPLARPGQFSRLTQPPPFSKRAPQRGPGPMFLVAARKPGG